MQCSVLEGDPAPAILSCARRENVDVIVMGTHRPYPLSWVSRMIKGAVAGSVAAAANLPVILVKDVETDCREPAKPDYRELAEAA